MTEFRCAPDPRGTVQQCTYCGAPGMWSEAGLKGTYAPPTGHTERPDGTLECPRSIGDKYADAPCQEWSDREATRFLTLDGQEWRP